MNCIKTKEHLFDGAIYGIMNHDINHVHVMFRAQPEQNLIKFINAYKKVPVAGTTVEINRQYI